MIGVEDLTRHLPDTERALQLRDDGLHLGAAVVVASDIVEGTTEVVGEDDVCRVFEIGPEKDLLTDIAVEGAHRYDANVQPALLPLGSRKVDLGDLSQRPTVGVRVDCRPPSVVHDGAEEIRGEASLHEKMSASSADFFEEFGAITACIDAYDDAGCWTDRRADAVDVRANRRRVRSAEASITGAKNRADASLRFGDDAEQRMVARTSVVARIRAGQRALLVTEERFDGGVHVEVNAIAPEGANLSKTLVGHHEFELGEVQLVYATQVAV
jgi:hypothetical protein